MTGFRLARGGAQELYNIKPDLTTFGKIIGGGLPVGAYGGRAEIMKMIAPSGSVYQAGTLSGNPLAMTAGLETLKAIDADEHFYCKLDESCEYLYEGLRNNLKELKLNYKLNRCGSMFTLFFSEQEITNLIQRKHRTRKFSRIILIKCWRAAFIFHRRNLKLVLCPSPTLNKILINQLKQII